MPSHWTLILLAAASNVVLNLSLKRAGGGFDTSGARQLALSIVLSPWTWLAVLAAAVLLTAFVAAVRVYSLSLTYTAVTALAMLTLTAIGIGLGEDSATPARMGGLALVIAGLLVLSRTG